MLDRFPSLLAASTFLVMSLSVTHEWGYYSQFDHIQALVSPSDYFSSALLWLPYIAVTYFVLAVVTMLQWRLEGFKFLSVMRPRRVTYHLAGAMVILLAVGGFFVTPPPEVWY
jgi:hypothetical protein